jgi:hypothetical protein
MSAKGNKAKADKDPTHKRAPSAGRLPARSPLDDGVRSQMLGLSSNLSLQRRSNSPHLPGLSDPPPRKRKATLSLDATVFLDHPSASAADKSSSAEDTPISASAADKSSSVEGTPSKTPEKEHSAIEGEKGTVEEKGNTPLSSTESAKASVTEGKARISRTSLLGP